MVSSLEYKYVLNYYKQGRGKYAFPIFRVNCPVILFYIYLFLAKRYTSMCKTLMSVW